MNTMGEGFEASQLAPASTVIEVSESHLLSANSRKLRRICPVGIAQGTPSEIGTQVFWPRLSLFPSPYGLMWASLQAALNAASLSPSFPAGAGRAGWVDQTPSRSQPLGLPEAFVRGGRLPAGGPTPPQVQQRWDEQLLSVTRVTHQALRARASSRCRHRGGARRPLQVGSDRWEHTHSWILSSLCLSPERPF